MIRGRAAAVASALLIGTGAAPLSAQGVALQLGRLFADGGWTSYGVTWVRPLVGPVSIGIGGMAIQGPVSTDSRLWGGNAEVSLFRGGRPGAYAVTGISGGFGTGAAEHWWRSWSAGVGYELLPLRVLSLSVEGRYREFGVRGRSGIELSMRLGASFGAAPTPATVAADTMADRPVSRAQPTPSQPSQPMPSRSTDSPAMLGTALGRSNAEILLDGVVATADSAIGARYRLGGRGEDGRGFDCSGLIQYAYSRHGITLPRRSVDQARQGRELGRDVNELRPGDLLTFSSSGQEVTHVGMYVGDGRFIHSASSGVQTSVLSASDPYGKWWFKRWVGARRIVE